MEHLNSLLDNRIHEYNNSNSAYKLNLKGPGKTISCLLTYRNYLVCKPLDSLRYINMYDIHRSKHVKNMSHKTFTYEWNIGSVPIL